MRRWITGILLLSLLAGGVHAATNVNEGDGTHVTPSGSGSSSGSVSGSNFTITNADPSVILDTTTATDTDFWVGIDEDAGGDDDDKFQIGTGSTPLTNEFLSFQTGDTTTQAVTLWDIGSLSTSLHLADVDVVHGVTTICPTNVAGRFGLVSGTNGGLAVRGLSDNASALGLLLNGIMVADPTDTVPAVQIRASVANGTGVADIAAAETAFQVSDSTGADDYLTVDGAGNLTLLGVLNMSPAAGDQWEINASAGSVLTIANATDSKAVLQFWLDYATYLPQTICTGTQRLTTGPDGRVRCETTRSTVWLQHSSSASTSSTFYVQPGGLQSTNEGNGDQWVTPSTCTAYNLTAEVVAAPGEGKSWQVCANVNGTAQQPCCQISNTNTQCSQRVQTGTLTGQQSFNWEFLAANSPAATSGQSVSMECEK